MAIPNATTVWIWSEEYGPESARIGVTLCDDDGEPIDDSGKLFWYYYPDDAAKAYDHAYSLAETHGLEVIDDDLAHEHRGIAMANSDW